MPRKGRTPGIQSTPRSQLSPLQKKGTSGINVSKKGWSIGADPAQLAAGLGLFAAQALALDGAAEALKESWEEVLSEPGAGRLYEEGVAFVTHNERVFPVPGEGRAHQASEKGQPPAEQDGDLASAIEIEKNSKLSRLIGMGGDIGRRGLALEYGVNVPGSRVAAHPGKNLRIEPRPHARPAKERVVHQMTQIMRKTLKTGSKAR